MDLESLALAEVETSIAYVGVALKYDNMDGGGKLRVHAIQGTYIQLYELCMRGAVGWIGSSNVWGEKGQKKGSLSRRWPSQSP